MQHARPSENGLACCIDFQTLPLIFTHMKTHKILFVCLGNICRSPMAEYVLRHRARKAGMDNAVITASAGTSGWHDGEDMHEGTRRALKQHGIDPSCFTSSKIKPSDAEHFDYIIVMDDNNLRETEKQLGFHPGKIFKLTDLRRTNHMLFMRDSLDSIVEPVLNEMGRFYDWTEEEKAAYRADVEAALANNDLAELK